MAKVIILEYQKLRRNMLLLLNPDAILEENCLKEIYKAQINIKG